MRSVADRLRGEIVERVLRMTPAERVDLTARLAEDDLRLFAAAHHVDQNEARGRLARQRQRGRHASGAVAALLHE